MDLHHHFSLFAPPTGDAADLELRIVVILVMGWVVGILLLTRLEIRRARALSRAADLENLRRGPVVLAGVVELARGGTAPPIEVRYHERLEEASDDNFVWRGEHRDCEARPFYLRLDDGKRIRVEPAGAAIELAATHEDAVSTGTNTQVRSTRIQEGQRVLLAGELRSGEDEEAPAALVGAPYRETRAGALVVYPFRGQLAITTGKVLPSQSGFRFVHLYWLIGAAIVGLFLFGAVRDLNAPPSWKTEARIQRIEVKATRNQDGGLTYACTVFADVQPEGKPLYNHGPIPCAIARLLQPGAMVQWPLYSERQVRDETLRNALPKMAFVILLVFIALQLMVWRFFRPWQRAKPSR